MKHEILENGDLKISVTDAEREELRQQIIFSNFNSNMVMCEVLEPLICNSDLNWCSPEQIGALIDAPILATFGDTRPVRENELVDVGNRLVGQWDGQTWVEPVQSAWAFMDYQVISVQARLLADGYTIWQKAR